VVASKARLLSLRIVPPGRLYALRVTVNDPAAYLKHRMNRVADFMTTRPFPPFRSSSFTVVDHAGKRAFWIDFTNSPDGSGGYDWYVRPSLVACIDNNDLGIESNPDGTAPACPAR
jgi:hypothetical protein